MLRKFRLKTDNWTVKWRIFHSKKLDSILNLSLLEWLSQDGWDRYISCMLKNKLLICTEERYLSFRAYVLRGHIRGMWAYINNWLKERKRTKYTITSKTGWRWLTAANRLWSLLGPKFHDNYKYTFHCQDDPLL